MLPRTAGILALALGLAMTACGNGNGHREHRGTGAAAGLPVPGSPPAAQAVVTMGRPGDRWVDTLPWLAVSRASRGGRPGYQVTYAVPGHGRYALFWPRDRIDLAGTAPRDYRVRTLDLGGGRLHYPDRLTRQSLPWVYRSVLIIERDHDRLADGMIAATEMFALVASLGTGVRTPHASTAGSGAGAGAAAAEVAASRTLARAMEAAGQTRPAGAAAHHIVAGKAAQAAPARAVLRRFRIGINDPANGVFLPATRAAPDAAGTSIHSTLHTKAYYQAVNDLLHEARTQQAVLDRLESIRQGLLRGAFP